MKGRKGCVLWYTEPERILYRAWYTEPERIVTTHSSFVQRFGIKITPRSNKSIEK